jgi:hypothetical protein
MEYHKKWNWGNNTKYDIINTLNSDKEYKSGNADIFNIYFLTVAENVSCKIKESNEHILSYNKDSLFYLSQAFNHPFTNVVFHNTSTGEIEKIITPSLGKTHVDMMRSR